LTEFSSQQIAVLFLSMLLFGLSLCSGIGAIEDIDNRAQLPTWSGVVGGEVRTRESVFLSYIARRDLGRLSCSQISIARGLLAYDARNHEFAEAASLTELGEGISFVHHAETQDDATAFALLALRDMNERNDEGETLFHLVRSLDAGPWVLDAMWLRMGPAAAFWSQLTPNHQKLVSRTFAILWGERDHRRVTPIISGLPTEGRIMIRAELIDLSEEITLYDRLLENLARRETAPGSQE